MAIRNDNLLGSDWVDDETLYAADLNDTFDASLRGGYGMTAIGSDTAENNSVFLDSVDNEVKVKDNSGNTVLVGGATYQTTGNISGTYSVTGTFADVTDMSITVAKAGTYLVLMNMQGYVSNNGNDDINMKFRLYDDAVIIFAGESNVSITVNQLDSCNFDLSAHAVVTVSVNDVIKVQAEVDHSPSTANIYDRNLTIIRLA